MNCINHCEPMGHHNTIADYQDVDNYLEVSNNLETDNINDTQDIGALTIEAQAPQEWAPRTQGPILQRSSAVSSCCSFWLLVSDFRSRSRLLRGSLLIQILFLNYVLCVPQESHVYMEMRDLQQEVQSLRQRMNLWLTRYPTLP